MKKNNLFLFAILALASCTVGPDYHAPKFLSDNQIFASLELKNAPSRAIPADWYRQFNDQTLNYLISCGLRDSPSVLSAIRRLRAARAELNISRADNLPMFNASGAYKYDKPAKNIGQSLKSNYYQAGLDASWELDIWGGGRRQKEASQALFKAAAADLDNVRITLIAEIANTYIDLRVAQEQLRLSLKNLKLQRSIAELVAEKYRAGLADDIALNQANYAVETTQSLLPALRQNISSSSNALAILTGVLPKQLSVKLEPVTHNLAARRFEFNITNMFEIPARVVRARPDVRIAEQQLIAQNAKIGQSVAALFPDIKLSAMFGYQSIRGTRLFVPNSEAFSWSPALELPVFQWGRLVNNIEQQKELKAEYLELYKQSILTAVGEIKDAMSAVQNEYRKNQADYRAEEDMRRVHEYTLAKYRQGLISFSDLLDAEQRLLNAQNKLAASNGAIYQNLIAYYKAVGGGFEPALY